KARPYIDRCETLAPQAAPSLALGFYHILRWAHVYFGGQDALDVALEEIASAQDQDDPTFLCYGYFHAATSYWRRSELAPALAYSRKAEDAYDPIMGKAMAQAGDFDPLVLTYITRGGYLNQLGRLHEADACLRQAHDWAREIGHPQIEATVWSYAVMMLGIRECTGAQLLECAAKARELSEKYGYQEGLDLALLGRASGLLRLGRPAESCTAYETYLAQTHARTYMQASLAWVELALARSRSDQAEPAHAAIDEAFRLIAQNADRLWDVEACRARAELALRHGGDVQTAEHDLRQAIALADSRDNRLSSLRAACTLSELLRDSGRCEEAIALLTDKLQAMPDQDHPELAPAQRLLRALQSGPTLPRDDRPSLPQGRWQRGLQVAGLASRVAAGRLRQAALAPWHAASKRDEARLRHRRDEATDVAQTLGQMRGVAMKLGQIASFATPGLNPEMQAALESLQADAPPMDFDQACRVLSEELGAPLEALFSEFDETPVAAASIGQVHRARCHDGRELAVKIQYPGLAETIRSDLANTAAVTRLAKLVMPALEPGPVVQELRERLGEELDYRHEARCQQLFYELWNGHPSLRVPRVIPELSGSRVLTAEFVHGRKLGALGAEDPALKTRVGESILRFAVGSSVRFSVFNGDPHPGNYLVDAQGKVCLLDFGCTKFWSESFAEPWMRICHALREADFAAVNEAAVETGIMKPRAGYDPQLACEYIALLQSLYTRRGVHRMSYAETHQLLRQAARPSGRFRSVARYLNMPRDMVLMYRFLFGVNTILADLKASGPWRDIFGEYYYRDPPATPLGEEEQAFRARWYAERKLNPAARYARTFEGFRPCAPFAYELWARS
ncbi:MAG: AarF/UbiB family protein, partial [Oceanococcaceae bacterium]